MSDARPTEEAFHEIEFVLDSPRSEVWRALVDPAALREWYASDARVTLEVGGEFFVVHGRHERRGTIDAIVEGVRLRTTAGRESTEVTLEDRGRSTVVRVVQSGFGEAGAERIGSAEYVSTLESYLKRRGADPTLRRPRYVIAVADLERTTRFFVDALGFGVERTGDSGWRFFVRDECSVMASECIDAPSTLEIGDHSYFAYIEVDDIERLHASCAAKGVEIIKPLRVEPWGMREFGIRTVDGHRMMFGAVNEAACDE